MNVITKRATRAAGSALVAIAAILIAGTSRANVVDLTAVQAGTISGVVGGNAYVANQWSQPTGTGVFDPFLTLRNEGGGTTEKAFNTDGSTQGLFNDEHRPTWNTLLLKSSLAVVTAPNGVASYAFILDANEPGANKSLITVDNIEIYVSNSATAGATVGNLTGSNSQQQTQLNGLGTRIWALNDIGSNTNRIELDANQQNVLSNANGGSGIGDMILYVPVSLFGSSTYVYFYNSNGNGVNGSDQDSTDGYEEWRAVTGVTPPPPSVPDGGTTAMLLGGALFGLFALRRRQLV
jgi:hypothetical protein